MVRAAGGIIDASDFIDGAWADWTMPAGYSAVGSFAPRSRIVTDGIFISGRIQRPTAGATGTVLWAQAPDGHRPLTVWELNQPWFTGSGVTSVGWRMYWNTDGGLYTVGFPAGSAGSTQSIYFNAFIPTK